MKQIITMLSLVVMSTMFIVGCSSSKNSDNLYLGNCPDNMIGMGKKYFINNLEDGNYEIEFIATESLNIDEEFEIGNNNLKDLVVYMKLHKTN